MRTLSQVLTEEYSEFGVHVANIVIDGLIDSPGTRALAKAKDNPDAIINPEKIAEAFFIYTVKIRRAGPMNSS